MLFRNVIKPAVSDETPRHMQAAKRIRRSTGNKLPAKCGPLIGMTIEPHERFSRSSPVEQVALSRRMMKAGLPKLSLVIHGEDYAVHARRALQDAQSSTPLDSRWTQHNTAFNVYDETSGNTEKEHASSFRFASSRAGGRIF
ncbi:MAG: hypothetical protein Alpg2KO_21780 [Alphaproteobacteria bacterium]